MSKDEKAAVKQLKIDKYRTQCTKEQLAFIDNDVEKGAKYVFYKAYCETAPSNKIKAKCLDCSCYQREEITKCTAKTCPLYSVRPYRK